MVVNFFESNHYLFSRLMTIIKIYTYIYFFNELTKFKILYI